MQSALVISETFNSSRCGPGKENYQNQGRQETTDSNPELATSLLNIFHKTLGLNSLPVTLFTLYA
jgi:hypothetical protein